MTDKVAVVTGSNKGIGYSIVKELCKRGVGSVYLTARDVIRGQDAVAKLKKEGYHVLFHQLEVTNGHSVQNFAKYLKQKHGGLDILINNAGVITADFTKTTYEDSKYVIDVNYKSILIIQEHIFPILKHNARVINMSSDSGHISILKNKYWIDRLTDEDVSVNDINEFVEWFLESVKNDINLNEDFVEMEILAYIVSKIAISALTRVQQREVSNGISINSLNPGFVKTDMTRNTGDLTVEEACKTPVYLALDINQSVKGKYFWFDGKEKDWTDPSLKIHSVYGDFEKKLKEIGQL